MSRSQISTSVVVMTTLTLLCLVAADNETTTMTMTTEMTTPIQTSTRDKPEDPGSKEMILDEEPDGVERQQQDDGNERYEAVIVSILYDNPELSYKARLVRTAIEVAIRHVSKKYASYSFRPVFRIGNRSCHESLASGFAAEEFYQRRATVFIGPGCSDALDQVARLGSFWNVPVLTAGGIDEAFSNKRIFTTLTRLAFSLDRVSDFLLSILDEFGWSHFALFVDENHEREKRMSKSVESAVFRRNSDSQHFNMHRFYFRPTNRTSYTTALKDASTKARGK